MSRLLRTIRYRAEYVVALAAYVFLRWQPHFMVKIMAVGFGRAAYLLPPVSTLINANLKTAFPEKSAPEIRRIGRSSLVNTIRNMLEFFWMNNNRRRIEKCTVIPPDVAEILEYHGSRGERLVMVNPHLGSWEASALIVTYYSGKKTAVIVNPLRNPYLNRLLNLDNRETTPGLQVIFSRGALRASIRALRQGCNIGIVIDQNTKVREGGAFVNFFGLPVPCSQAPAEFFRFGKANKIKIVVIFGVSLRREDGIIATQYRHLSKPPEEYEPEEMTQELISISEQFIRRYPEQYLWLYKRFAHIPQGLDENLKQRYPDYARVVKNSFYSRVKKKRGAETGSAGL
ncbi:MAG: hypothetical protein PHH77_00645 [Victivallaceae bacterium]|nr:hypothetical protein [Victivallaceae bacterium]